MSRYAVALVHTKQNSGSIDISVRQAIVAATSEAEALGLLVREVKMKGYALSNHVVTPIEDK